MKKILAITILFGVLCGKAWAESVAYDPYEGYNRFMFGVNDRIDRNILSPVARGYRAVTPKPVRSGIGNFFNNLRDIVSIGSNLLRLDIAKAGTDLVRVGLNTTLGFGGLIDIAGAAQMPDNKNSLGDTFASWGWKNSNYFVYPLLGPSTVRDAVGNTITNVYSPEKLALGNGSGYWAATGIKTLDTRAGLLDLTDSLEQASLDRYAYVRDVYMAARAKQTGTTLPGAEDDYVPSFEEDSGASDHPAEPTEAPADTDAVQPGPPASIIASDTPAITENNNLGDIRHLAPNTIHIETLAR